MAVTEALAEVEPATSSAFKMMNARVPHIDAVLPTLLDALRRASAKLVLVIDDAHLLDSEAAAEVIHGIAEGLPMDAQLALAGRAAAPVQLGRLRARTAGPWSWGRRTLG